MNCSVCGKEIDEKKEGVIWRYCSFCKKPICFDDVHYIGVWRQGLYKDYVEVLPICEKCMPKKRPKSPLK